MSAGRLLRLMLLLQGGSRVTAAELADQLEVSVRTVLRDVETLSGSGVPVFATRGPGGGIELLEQFDREVPAHGAGLFPARGRLRRIRVALSASALNQALVTGRPEAWRPRPRDVHPDHPEWLVGSFRFDSDETALRELLGLGPELEVLLPVSFRARMAEVGSAMARRHRGDPP